MNKQEKVNTTKTQKYSPSKTHEELLQALYYIWELLDRIPIPFVLVESTAESAILNQPLEGDGVHLGVRTTDWYGSNLTILNLVLEPVEKTQKVVTYMHNNTPIYIHIYKPHETINSPDVVTYHFETFYVPNPYETFSQVAHTLQ